MKHLPLSRNKGFTILDDADYERAKGYTWSLENGYARGWMLAPDGVTRRVFLHRWLLDAARGSIIDHINGNRLDNRRENLRFATYSENARNVGPRGAFSKYKGVFPVKGGWRAALHLSSAYTGGRPRTLYLGVFHTDEIAARVWDEAARKHYGASARLNFPDTPTDQAPETPPAASEQLALWG